MWRGRRSARYHRKKVDIFHWCNATEDTYAVSLKDPGYQSIPKKTDQISNGNFQLSRLILYLLINYKYHDNNHYYYFMNIFCSSMYVNVCHQY